VNETLGRLLLIEGLTLAAAGLVVAFGGGWLIRRELVPLDRVAKTARAVSALPLSSGSTKLDQRVPAGDVGTEVGDVANALNEMLEHVDESLAQRAETERQLRQFVADASHELRTPLTSIRGYAELYRRPDIDTEGQRTAMARIESEASRMGTLVDDLLLLARLDQGRPLLHEPVDVCNLVAETVSDIAVSAQDHAISVDLPEAAVFIVGDEGRLRQVLGNLVANAVQHTPAGTSVAVTVAVENDNVVISVADSGPGVPADFQPHAFERFTRADESRARSSGGSGLGLSIAAAVVRALDGTVALTSEPGRTVVSVTLQQSADRRA
jgi:two-component system OmpR family sensor kinase